ncbi:fructosamine kinase family protein [Jejuia pallidilutea]|uniref:Ribulosamine/erythrulosamine 3-kinase n=1 Tax=Jejuia pallidilutea TaxID=504487 RepID=A0A090VWC7_9FLAO|nr:fructosamine kinase family protein [Jejuia pallidilutea]GAL67579.1 ribulosamine/erythrulosamine 3-kinase [Jejuia pallidilutea]GAL89406.1 ribulosamine/erythrulosamine 3-kinase [Jejuia pallidilutea]
MTSNLKKYLSNFITETITKVSSISGGDISKAYNIETISNTYFLKLNTTADALKMFQLEAKGLRLIEKTKTIKTPKVLACDIFEGAAFLLLEFIESKVPSDKDFENLGHQLANLHQCTSENFGLDEDNFIGRLPQSNTKHKSWVDFYTFERLLPQLQLAQQKHLLSKKECPVAEHITTKLQSYFEDIKPSLLHGDLWSGNYLISKNGEPYLIDPAVYYGHNDVDIAMSKLFGGFNSSFYEAYQCKFHINTNTKDRVALYQLYYLLVHLNMFGNSYYGSVSKILKTYF